MSNTPLDFDPTEDDPLERIGADVVPPDDADDLRERFRTTGTTRDLGRLADLALWWAEVRGEDRPQAPSRVVAIGAAATVGLPDGVARRPLDPPSEVADAVAWGAALADELADTGTDLALLALPLGLPGRALTGYLMGLDPVETNGPQPGPDLDDEAWMREVEHVRDDQWRLRGLRGRPMAMVTVLADPRLAAGTAFLLRSAGRRTPVLLDGPGAVTTGLLAARCSRSASRWWLPAEVGDVPLHARSLGSLGLTAVTRLDLLVEDGTACTAVLPLLGLAAGVLAHA